MRQNLLGNTWNWRLAPTQEAQKGRGILSWWWCTGGWHLRSCCHGATRTKISFRIKSIGPWWPHWDNKLIKFIKFIKAEALFLDLLLNNMSPYRLYSPTEALLTDTLSMCTELAHLIFTAILLAKYHYYVHWIDNKNKTQRIKINGLKLHIS